MNDDAYPAPRGSLRLIGASLWSRTGSAVEHLLGLRSHLARAHRAAGLRCALMHSSGWLVQWLEGPADAVESAWARMGSDPELRGTCVLHRSTGKPLLTQPIHIASLHSGDTPADVAARIQRIGRQAAQGTQAEPGTIWQELSAPCQLDSLEALAGGRRRDVVAITSEDNESVDLLLGIAQACGSRVSYQRFAEVDARMADVGAAYADLDHGHRITRVQALSRGALTHTLVRLGLVNLQCVVLLLGSRERSGTRLAESAASLLADLHIAPVVHLVGTDEEVLASAAAILRAAPGLNVTQSCTSPSSRRRLDAVMRLMAGAPGTLPAPPHAELA